MPPIAKSKDKGRTLSLDVIKTMWENGRPVTEIITLSNLTRTRLYKLAVAEKWTRSANYAITGKKEKDPSAEEIAERAAEVRARWAPDEAERRFTGKKREAAYTPALTYDVRAGAFLPASVPR